MNFRLIHSTCWSHIIHLLSEEVRSEFKTADRYIFNVKSALIKSPGRRQELLNVLCQHGLTAKLPPVPVLTRWTTWLETGNFHYKNYAAVKEWILNTKEDSLAIKNLKTLCNKPKLVKQLEKISNICPTISSVLKKLEGTKCAASSTWGNLEKINQILETEELSFSKLNCYMKGSFYYIFNNFLNIFSF